MTEAGKRGIVVEVVLFSSYYGSGWPYSPMNAANNVNGVGAVPKEKANTLDNGNLLAEQERVVRKIVAELRDFDNVYYEIQNEPWADHEVAADVVNFSVLPEDVAPPGAFWKNRVDLASPESLAWQARIAAVVTEEEDRLGVRHLVAQNYCNHRYPVRDVDPVVAILNFHYAWPEAATLNAGLGRVVSCDETGFASPGDRVAARETDAVYRRQAWEFLMAGGGIFSMLDYSFAVGHEDGTFVNRAPGGGSPALRRQLRVLKDFLHSFDIPDLEPRPGARGDVPGRLHARDRDEEEARSLRPGRRAERPRARPAEGRLARGVDRHEDGRDREEGDLRPRGRAPRAGEPALRGRRRPPPGPGGRRPLSSGRGIIGRGMGPMRLRVWLAMALVLAAAASSPAADEFVVIVHPSVAGVQRAPRRPRRRVPEKATRWGGGATAVPVDQSGTSPVRNAFSESVLGMPVATAVQYWQKQMFAANPLRPPAVKGSDAEVIAFVAKTRGRGRLRLEGGGAAPRREGDRRHRVAPHGPGRHGPRAAAPGRSARRPRPPPRAPRSRRAPRRCGRRGWTRGRRGAAPPAVEQRDVGREREGGGLEPGHRAHPHRRHLEHRLEGDPRPQRRQPLEDLGRPGPPSGS